MRLLYPPRLDLTLAAGLGAELLEYGAIADQKNDKGKTPLDKAIEHELDYRPKHSGARHSSHIVQLLEDALGGLVNLHRVRLLADAIHRQPVAEAEAL